ncbi:MAG: NAD(P)-binding domain-containing protein [Egibacteraceae bacterium]
MGDGPGERDVGFVDAGVSGGVWGLDEGYCIMAGGSETDISHLRPVFHGLVTEGGFAHVGPVGAGHFTWLLDRRAGGRPGAGVGQRLRHAAVMSGPRSTCTSLGTQAATLIGRGKS